MSTPELEKPQDREEDVEPVTEEPKREPWLTADAAVKLGDFIQRELAHVAGVSVEVTGEKYWLKAALSYEGATRIVTADLRGAVCAAALSDRRKLVSELGRAVDYIQQCARRLVTDRDYQLAQWDFAKTGICLHGASKSRIKCTVCRADLLVCSHQGSRGFIKCTICGGLMPGSGFDTQKEGIQR